MPSNKYYVDDVDPPRERMLLDLEDCLLMRKVHVCQGLMLGVSKKEL